MENTEQATLVIKDQEGEYYLLPQAALESGRVPAEHKAEVERLLAESHDVSGHLFFLGVFVGTLIGGGATIGALAYQLNNQDLSGVMQEAASWAQDQLR